ncbi:MAG: hypothetical protein KF833_05445 [Verrucomicrobiae bacterium]|nr:hypothetical protein [Verrucomicrobiae bacterium]
MGDKAANRRDELGGANLGTLPDADDPDQDDPRRFGPWASLMAGGAGVEWYFGWQNNSPFSDLSCEDWRTRESMYRQTRIALDFFHEHLPFWWLAPADEAVVGHGAQGLFAPGELYAIHLPHGGGTRFDLGDHPGLYEILWFNPRTGEGLRPGNIRQGPGPGLTWTGFPPGTDYASGLNHNLCIIIPEWEMVIVRMGVDGNAPPGTLDAFLRRLTLAVSPLPADP